MLPPHLFSSHQIDNAFLLNLFKNSFENEASLVEGGGLSLEAAIYFIKNMGYKKLANAIQEYDVLDYALRLCNISGSVRYLMRALNERQLSHICNSAVDVVRMLRFFTVVECKTLLHRLGESHINMLFADHEKLVAAWKQDAGLDVTKNNKSLLEFLPLQLIQSCLKDREAFASALLAINEITSEEAACTRENFIANLSLVGFDFNTVIKNWDDLLAIASLLNFDEDDGLSWESFHLDLKNRNLFNGKTLLDALAMLHEDNFTHPKEFNDIIQNESHDIFLAIKKDNNYDNLLIFLKWLGSKQSKIFLSQEFKFLGNLFQENNKFFSCFEIINVFHARSIIKDVENFTLAFELVNVEERLRFIEQFVMDDMVDKCKLWLNAMTVDEPAYFGLKRKLAIHATNRYLDSVKPSYGLFPRTHWQGKVGRERAENLMLTLIRSKTVGELEVGLLTVATQSNAEKMHSLSWFLDQAGVLPQLSRALFRI